VTAHANIPDTAIFVRLPNWVGDVCMSLPSLALLTHTRQRLVLCARPWARELLAGWLAEHKMVQDFIPMTGRLVQDRRAVAATMAAVATRGGQAKTHQMRGLLLPDSLSSALAFRLAGLPSAGYRDDGRSLLLRWPVSKPDKSEKPLHAVQTWHFLTRSALQRWQLPVLQTHPSTALNLSLTEAQVQQAQQTLIAAGLTERRFILIAPTATGLHKGKIKVWPGFRALTQRLMQHGLTVAMCPPAAELEQARAAVPEAVRLPPLPLGAFAALTRLSALTVCNDSGVSHLAAAVQAAQLTLFGVTQPARTAPWSEQAQCLGAMDNWPNVQDVLQAVLSTVR